jgi:hypothetical protein
MIEAPGSGKPFLITKQIVNASHSIPHTSVLSAEYGLHLTAAEPTRPEVNPTSEGKQDRLGVAVSSLAVDIQKSGEQLVRDIIWHITTCERTALEFVILGFGETREVSSVIAFGAIVLLTFEKLSNKGGSPVLAFAIPKLSITLSPSCEEMTLHVGAEGERGSIPASIGSSTIGGQAMVLTVDVKEPVEINRLEIRQSSALVVLEATAC